MTCHVFISYRRNDSSAWAGRIFDRLAQIFPSRSVFIDVDGIEPGLDFAQALTERLSTCKVMLVVIGPKWLSIADAQGQRLLDRPQDYVSREIQAALERDIRVIPVLVDGARMPGESDLPPALIPLAGRQAVELSHARFLADSEVLVESVTRAALSEIPEHAGRLGKSGASDQSGPAPASAGRGFGLLSLLAIGSAVLGLLVTIGGVLGAYKDQTTLFWLQSPTGLSNSLLDAIYEGRWTFIFGVVTALSAIASVSRAWRRSERGAQFVAVFGVLAAAASGLYCAVAAVVTWYVVEGQRSAFRVPMRDLEVDPDLKRNSL